MCWEGIDFIHPCNGQNKAKGELHLEVFEDYSKLEFLPAVAVVTRMI
jgi:hypothetical protein